MFEAQWKVNNTWPDEQIPQLPQVLVDDSDAYAIESWLLSVIRAVATAEPDGQDNYYWAIAEKGDGQEITFGFRSDAEPLAILIDPGVSLQQS